MISFAVVVILVAFVDRGTSEQIPFLPCEDAKAVTALYITPCNGTLIDNWRTCVLMHGIEATIEASFVPPFDSPSLQTLTMITIDGIEAPTPYSGYDPCNGSIVPRCPIEEGKPYLFSRSYSVQREFPVGSTALRLIIRDMATKDIAACAKVPIVIDPNPAYFYEN